METIGQKISPILVEIENALWEYEAWNGSQPKYTDEGFRASIKIFMSALMDRMYNLQTSEELALEDKEAMAESLGKQVRAIIKTYCDIDTHELYG